MDNINHILVGLGGTGGKVLRAFKMRMFEEYPDSEVRNRLPVGLLYVDSTREMMGVGRPDFRVLGQDASFTENEFVSIKSVDVSQILDNINYFPALKGIIGNVEEVRAAIGSLGEAAGQKRRAGRILFAANAIRYKNALDTVYARVNNVSKTGEVMIHIFTGLAGGTGSGSIIDAITQTRKAYPGAEIIVYAMVPDMTSSRPGMDTGLYYPNCYAALNEINGLQTGRFVPCDVSSAGRQADLFSIHIQGVADGVVLYSNVNENGVPIRLSDELPKLVADYAYFRVFLDTRYSEVIDFYRVYNFHALRWCIFEYDEGAGNVISRSKKFSSFGIKRVIYPETRILQHMTYSVGQRLLYQFQYNHWRDNYGYVGEPANKDYKEEYLKEDKVKKWMLDNRHLMLEERILWTEKYYESFQDYWHDKAVGYADEPRRADHPLYALNALMKECYDNTFRGGGVDEFYMEKTKIIHDLAREIRQNIERDLFTQWKEGAISLYDLMKIAETVLAYMGNQQNELNEESVKAQENLENWENTRKADIFEWDKCGFWQGVLLGKKKKIFAKHQETLTEYYVAKTTIRALEFAKRLAARLLTELNHLYSVVSECFYRVSQAIDECDRLIAANSKKNKGIEDMTNAIIEVSDEARIANFEKELMTNKRDQSAMATELRKVIVPEGDFTPFDDLVSRISVDCIKDAFDIRLSLIIREKHEIICGRNDKLLGLNILQQLQQVLTTDEEIQKFALELVKESSVCLKFNDTEMNRYIPHERNENPAVYPSSVNCRHIQISIPSTEGNEELKHFADKLANAFKNSYCYNSGHYTILQVNKENLRKDELSIVSVVYCFPLRAIDGLADYKERYEKLLMTADGKRDPKNSILLHSEGDGSLLPPLFVPTEQERAAMAAANAVPTHPTDQQMNVPPTLSIPLPPVPEMSPEM